MDPLSGPVRGSALDLDELDHQALDLLDALDCGSAWRAAAWVKRGAAVGSSPASMDEITELHEAIERAGEEPNEVEAAVERVRSAFERVIGQVAANLLDAADELAATDARGALDPTHLATARSSLAARPDLATAIKPAVDLAAEILKLTAGSIAHALLADMADREPTDIPTSLATCTAAIAERWEAAASTTSLPEQIAKPLRVFRSAAVASAGPSIRAKALAADHPDLLALATGLVEHHSDPSALVDALDRAWAATLDQPPPDPHELIDGPKRKFTIVHAVLAAIILGLTLWHYIWR